MPVQTPIGFKRAINHHQRYIKLHHSFAQYPLVAKYNALRFLCRPPAPNEDPIACRVAVFWYISGLTRDQIANVLKVSPRKITDITKDIESGGAVIARSRARESVKTDTSVEVIQGLVENSPPLSSDEIMKRAKPLINLTKHKMFSVIKYIGWSWKLESKIVNCDSNVNMERRMKESPSILGMLTNPPTQKKERVVIWFDQSGFKSKTILRGKVATPRGYRPFIRDEQGWGSSQANICVFATKDKIIHVYFHKAPKKDEAEATTEITTRVALYNQVKEMYDVWRADKLNELQKQELAASAQNDKNTPSKNTKSLPPNTSTTTNNKRKSLSPTTTTTARGAKLVVTPKKAEVAIDPPVSTKKPRHSAPTDPNTLIKDEKDELVQLYQYKLKDGEKWGEGHLKWPQKGLPRKKIYNIDPQTGEMTFALVKSALKRQKMGITAEIMLEQIKLVVEMVRAERGRNVEIVLVADNAPVHDQEALAAMDVTWRALPKYSPELNLIEHIFSILKSRLRKLLRRNYRGQEWETVLEHYISKMIKNISVTPLFNKTVRILQLIPQYNGSLEMSVAHYRYESKQRKKNRD